MLVATGSTYRRTDADGEADLIGAGIHFCATCDGPFYRGAKDLTVVGGGNSGLEEGLFLTQFADHVTVVQAHVESDGQQTPAGQGREPPQDVGAVGHVGQVVQRERLGQARVDHAVAATAPRRTHETAGAFIFIGLDPNTSFLENSLDVDERGFIVTDAMFHTSVDGVFAAGDVRSGSTKQIASAVGEGAAVAIQIRYYLDSLDRVKVSS